LSQVELRQVANDYTIRFQGVVYQIARADVRPGLRGANVRLEARLDGSIAVRFQERYLACSECESRPKVIAPQATVRPKPSPRPRKSASERFGHIDLHSGPKIWQILGSNRTRTQDVWDGD
jgi:hypothetical protein